MSLSIFYITISFLIFSAPTGFIQLYAVDLMQKYETAMIYKSVGTLGTLYYSTKFYFLLLSNPLFRCEFKRLFKMTSESNFSSINS
jgi:hypothetical protein